MQQSPILITGAYGFIGEYLASSLKNRGEPVISLGRRTRNAVEKKDTMDDQSHATDLTTTVLQKISSDYPNVRTVYHLAGGSSVALSFKKPLDDFKNTVASTATLLDWCRSLKTSPKIVLVSSAAVYGLVNAKRIREHHPLQPISPYGSNKLAMEELAASYSRHFELDIAVARLFSVTGRGLRKQLLWDLCEKLSKSKRISLFGTGAELRDWIHVTDTVNALIKISATASTECPRINVGTGIGISVSDVVAIAAEAWKNVTGEKISIKFSSSSNLGNPTNLVARIDLLKSLEYQPQVNITTAIKDYVEWYLSQKREN